MIDFLFSAKYIIIANIYKIPQRCLFIIMLWLNIFEHLNYCLEIYIIIWVSCFVSDRALLFAWLLFITVSLLDTRGRTNRDFESSWCLGKVYSENPGGGRAQSKRKIEKKGKDNAQAVKWSVLRKEKEAYMCVYVYMCWIGSKLVVQLSRVGSSSQRVSEWVSEWVREKEERSTQAVHSRKNGPPPKVTKSILK